MLSQKLTKEVLSLSPENYSQKQQELKHKVYQSLSVWEKLHFVLYKGNDSMGLPSKNSYKINTMFRVLNETIPCMLKMWIK